MSSFIDPEGLKHSVAPKPEEAAEIPQVTPHSPTDVKAQALGRVLISEPSETSLSSLSGKSVSRRSSDTTIPANITPSASLLHAIATINQIKPQDLAPIKEMLEIASRHEHIRIVSTGSLEKMVFSLELVKPSSDWLSSLKAGNNKGARETFEALLQRVEEGAKTGDEPKEALEILILLGKSPWGRQILAHDKDLRKAYFRQITEVVKTLPGSKLTQDLSLVAALKQLNKESRIAKLHFENGELQIKPVNRNPTFRTGRSVRSKAAMTHLMNMLREGAKEPENLVEVREAAQFLFADSKWSRYIFINDPKISAEFAALSNLISPQSMQQRFRNLQADTSMDLEIKLHCYKEDLELLHKMKNLDLPLIKQFQKAVRETERALERKWPEDLQVDPTSIRNWATKVFEGPQALKDEIRVEESKILPMVIEEILKNPEDKLLVQQYALGLCYDIAPWKVLIYLQAHKPTDEAGKIAFETAIHALFEAGFIKNTDPIMHIFKTPSEKELVEAFQNNWDKWSRDQQLQAQAIIKALGAAEGLTLLLTQSRPLPAPAPVTAEQRLYLEAHKNALNSPLSQKDFRKFRQRLVRDIDLASRALLSTVTPADFAVYNRAKDKDKPSIPPMSTVVKLSSEISMRAIEDVLGANSKKEAKSLIEFYIDLANTLIRDHHNFFAAQAILGALESVSVGALTNPENAGSFELSKPHQEGLRKLQELFSAIGNFGAVRRAYKELDKEIPFVLVTGVPLTDLTMASDGNSSRREGELKPNRYKMVGKMLTNTLEQLAPIKDRLVEAPLLLDALLANNRDNHAFEAAMQTRSRQLLSES